MTYDQWKTRSPDDERLDRCQPYNGGEHDGRKDDDCDHADYEADILTGRTTCHRCGYAWWQTSDDLAQEAKWRAAYDAHLRKEERRERLAALWAYIASFFRRPKARPVVDDDVPF